MLSKPLAESSGGSSVATSISRSSRSRTTFAYSVRFRRWSTTDPGLTRAGRFAIDFRFQPVPEPFVFGERRPLHVRRRHHAGAKLPHDFFPQLRVIARRWRDPASPATGSPSSGDRYGRSRNTDREARAVSRPTPRRVLTRDAGRRWSAGVPGDGGGRSRRPGSTRLAVDRGGGGDRHM